MQIPTRTHSILLAVSAALLSAVFSASPLLYAQDTAAMSLPKQYKRVHQKVLRSVEKGELEKAIKTLDQFIGKFPKDAESQYMRAVALAKVGRMDEAVASVDKALTLGLPRSRFAGGTLTGQKSLDGIPAVRRIRDEFNAEPVHGPMVGAVTGNSASVWLRTNRPAAVRLLYSTSADLSNPQYSPSIRTSVATDHTAVLRILGLSPNSVYHYTTEINGRQSSSRFQLRTFAPQNEPVKFRLAFGGGAGYVPPHERMWTTIENRKPDALLLLGDNVYIDDPTSPAMQHYCYYRRQSRPEYRRLIGKIPVYSIWDDHDFGTNDCWGGPQIDSPAWKRPVFQVYRNNWVNPYYGGSDQNPGCYYDFYIGNVHFIMLDGRYYRDPGPRRAKAKVAKEGAAGGHLPSMLGPVQMQWLQRTLVASKGSLKIICSPVPWVYGAKGDSRDTWNGFKSERTKIFDHLTANKITGVVLMSADRHRSDLWKIDRPDAYSLYEFNSSRLTNQHVHPTMKKAIFSYNAKQSFGIVDIDTTVKDPTVRYRIVNIDNREVHSFQLLRSQLE